MSFFSGGFLVLLLALSFLLTGCDLLSVAKQHEKAEARCQLQGTVESETAASGDLVVVLFRHKGGSFEKDANWRLVDHFMLEHSGHWYFVTNPGTYYLTAFKDLNHNEVIEHNEPAIPIFNANNVFSCGPGETKNGIELVISDQGRMSVEVPVDVSKMQAHSEAEQSNVSLGQAFAVGAITSLDDPRFSPENADKGLWRPFDFTWQMKPGIYFLEPYDRKKIPVLFVHGMDGTPRDFSFLIEHLDRSRFQPWVAFYPSGVHLEYIALDSDQILLQLKAKYGFQKLFVVAHSMGGLIAREGVLDFAKLGSDGLISLFVSIACPWNGHSAAQLGVDYAPTAVYTWFDMAPGSSFLTHLFYNDATRERRRLPKNLPHHLIFTFLGTESGDGTVSLESQLRPEAQDDAFRLYGLLESHTGVLNDPRTSELLNGILSDVSAKQL